jgi:hypothetical protein
MDANHPRVSILGHAQTKLLIRDSFVRVQDFGQVMIVLYKGVILLHVETEALAHRPRRTQISLVCVLDSGEARIVTNMDAIHRPVSMVLRVILLQFIQIIHAPALLPIMDTIVNLQVAISIIANTVLPVLLLQIIQITLVLVAQTTLEIIVRTILLSVQLTLTPATTEELVCQQTVLTLVSVILLTLVQIAL